MAKYEAACAEIENLGFRPDQGAQNTKFSERGWA
jgi:hypothetical protein